MCICTSEKKSRLSLRKNNWRKGKITVIAEKIMQIACMYHLLWRENIGGWGTDGMVIWFNCHMAPFPSRTKKRDDRVGGCQKQKIISVIVCE